MYVSGSKPGGAEPPKPFETEAPAHGATGGCAFPVGFHSALVQSFLTMLPFLPFGMGLYTLYLYRSMQLFWLYGRSQLR